MSKKKHFSLQHSESVLVEAASRIYAAYIIRGSVEEGDETRWLERSIRDAVRIAQATDDLVISDDEIDASDAQDRGEIRVGRVGMKRSRHD